MIEKNLYSIEKVLLTLTSSSNENHSFTTDQKINTVNSVYLSSKYPSNEYGKGGNSYEGSMYVGYFSERGKTRSMIKLNTLPALSDGDVVVGAQLHLLQRASFSGVAVRASRVTGNWNMSTATWNNASSLKDSSSVDYYYATYGENNDFKVQSWDITSLMKGWYEGTYPNYGVMLTADSESGNTRSFCWYFSSTYPDAEAARPVFTIAYRNTKGIEPYWTYTSAHAARSTDIYVNHYNGSLTMVNTAAGVAGNRMPVTVQNIYNHGQAAWKTNFHMSVQTSPSAVREKYPYYFVDADGTEHCFYQKDGKFQDEDGLGYTLSIQENAEIRYIITDKQGGQIKFYQDGKLHSIVNSNNDSQTIEYQDDSSKISKVKDPSGRSYLYQYNASGLLSSVTDPAGRITRYEYSDNSHLTKIIDPDGKETTITYSGNYPTQITNLADGTKTKISYTANRKRVSQIAVYGSQGDEMESYTFSYKENHTVITDHDNRSYTYRFNRFGQTVSVWDHQTRQASYYEFGAPSTGKDSAKANKILSESDIQSAVTNYVKNPSFAFNAEGYQIYPSQAQDSLALMWDLFGHNGRMSMTITKENETDNDMFYYQRISSLKAGTYTFSAYVYVREEKQLSGEGVWLASDVFDSSGICYDVYSTEKIVDQETGWRRLSSTFTLKEDGAVNVGLRFGKNTKGMISIDDFQVEPGECVNSCNLLQNNVFLQGTGQHRLSQQLQNYLDIRKHYRLQENQMTKLKFVKKSSLQETKAMFFRLVDGDIRIQVHRLIL